MEKAFEELQIKDDFMFSVIMRNPKFCKPFLERILGIKISRIEYTFDLFGEGRHIYTFENRCIQNTELVLGDDTTKIILNTKGTLDDVTPEMKRLLDFIDGKEPEDDYTRELDKAVQAVRKNEKWRLDYMTLQMHYQEKYEQGIEHEKVETARRLIEIGKLSLEDIAAGTELSIEKVKEIAELQPV